MDRPISNTNQKKAHFRTFLKVGVGIVILCVAFYFFNNGLKTKIERNDFRIVTVDQGDVENTISASGLVVPAFEEQINSPIQTEIKKVYLKSGTLLKAGDLIMDLDDEFIRLSYESLKDELELKSNKIERLKLKYDKIFNELKYNDEIQGLELASRKAILADAVRLKEIGGATVDEVKKAELDMRIAELGKRKLENELNFRKRVIHNDKRDLELEVRIQKKKLTQLKRQLSKTSVRAARAGVLTWVDESIGRKVTEGEALARVSNLDNFKIEANCSDRYSGLLKTGMKVKVRINKSDLNGYVSAILPAVKDNTIQFIVDLEDAGAIELRANMRVEIYIVSDSRKHVLRVKNGSAFNGAKEQFLYVVNGDYAERRTVQIGLTNVDYVEIVGGDLKKGDQVIVSDMKSYKHLETVQLKP